MDSKGDTLAAFFLDEGPRAILEAAAALTERSCGRVRSPELYNRRTGKPERGGLHCARIFGPTVDLECLCGKLRGPAAAGAVCDKCGVECTRASVRAERWGHIDSPVPLVHPQLRAPIAAALGLSVDDLLRTLRFEARLREDGTLVRAVVSEDAWVSFADEDEDRSDTSGPRWLLERLPTAARALMIDRVPVPPPTWRATRGDPLDRAYVAFLNRCLRVARLRELNAPKIICDNEDRLAQEAFERVCEVARGELTAAREVRGRAPQSERAAALLAAVYAAPDSDEPRRAYAEHLQQHDDPRGEFILMQLATADVDVRKGMSKPARDLLRRNYDAWLGPLAPALESAVFRRGFLAEARTAAGQGAAVVGDPSWATVERLATDSVELIADPAMRSLSAISVSFSTLRALSSPPTVLPGITAVDVRTTGCPPRELGAVTDGVALPSLRELSVVHTSRRGAQRWDWLLETPLAQQLVTLTLEGALERLEALDLNAWIRALARHPQLERLTLVYGRGAARFELRSGDVGDVELRVRTGRGLLEWLSLRSEGTPSSFVEALTALAPDRVDRLRITSQGRWFGDELEGLAETLRGRFGRRLTLPRSA
ncbi:MAG: TIGR02996 domain-containing protein [Myxococcales bacterium]|nr:TIGR02996 domain-containing protein [Myxococcales bacterium]